METKKTAKSYSPEVKERAVRMVLEHQGEHASQWTAIGSIAAKIGCSRETLRKWLRRHERDAGLQNGMTSEVRNRLKALERENRELRQANEILRKASAYFAQAELDRRSRQNHDQRQGCAMPAGSRQPPVQGAKAERPLALRLHLCRNLDRLRLRRLRHRCLCPQDRGLAGLAHGARQLRARCAGAGPARSPTGPSRRARAS